MKIFNTQYKTNEYEDIFQEWSFELSDFQKWAIWAYKNEKNVIITANTGCGKTLPSEYAMKDVVEHKKKRVIYTTPLKALSNEKYHTFKEKYKHISFGLMTGDNQDNPDADVLVMTTEMYRNMLYKKDMIAEETITKEMAALKFDMDLENELGLVVYDEIHYFNNKDRGCVWEESIMKTPVTAQIMGLSATLNKPNDFCEWLEDKTKREVVLCPHSKRIIPLEHNMFCSVPNSVIKKMKQKDRIIIEEFNNMSVLLYNDEGFNEVNYYKMLKLLKLVDKSSFINKHYIMNKMVEYAKEKDQLPMLSFIFSKKQCYEYAKHITIPLYDKDEVRPNIDKECKQILISKITNYKEYIILPEYREIVRLLEKGIAVHHSGVTPVFKEMIEMMFKKKYIKLMFATESLGVGIDMGFRSTVYTSLQKYSDGGYRFVYPHEYAQMSGRAGRRGKDDKGYIYHLVNLMYMRNMIPSADMYRHIMSGQSQVLESKFKIYFDLILRLTLSNKLDIKEFVSDSMMCVKINKEKEKIYQEIQEMRNSYDKSKKSLNYLTTNIELLDRYKKLEDSVDMLSKKKKKPVIREMDNIMAESKHIKKDYASYMKVLELENKIKKLERKEDDVFKYVNNTVDIYIDLLIENKFMNESNDLTMKGKLAGNINEVNCLVMAELLHLNYLNDLSVIDLVKLFSIYTNIKLPDTDKITSYTELINSDNLNKVFEKMNSINNYYHDLEVNNKLDYFGNYEIHYDLCDLMENWCLAKTDEECLKIYEEAKSRGIYMGDYVKAISKINSIVEELSNVCLINENIELLEKLSKIKEHLLKSVAMNHSLYL